MITLSILIVLALICALVGVLMGLFSLIGLLASLLVGVLVGALAGHIANRFHGHPDLHRPHIVLAFWAALWVSSCSASSASMPPAASAPLLSRCWVPASASGWITDCSTIVDRFSLVVCLCSPLRESFFYFPPLDSYIEKRYNASMIYRIAIQSEVI